MDPLEIGKIIKGESQTIFWVQINAPTETIPEPSPEDCAFGNFVRIPINKRELDGKRTIDHDLIGVIIDTMLIDKDMLRAGPRLSQDPAITDSIFPTFFIERIKVVKILLIGFIQNGQNFHRFANTTMGLGDSVYKMEDSEISTFHLIKGDFQIGYYSQVLANNVNLIKSLMLDMLSRLMRIFATEQEFLQLLYNNIEYDLKIGCF